MLSQFASRQQANTAPLVIQIVGYKNSGKTTLIAKLIRHLKQAGLSVGTAKHDAHDFDMDKPGTDTWKHQEAGADMTAISSASRSAIISNKPEPLSALLAYMPHADIVLVEGFKHEPYPKIILFRDEQDEELLQLPNPWIAAVWPKAEALRPNIVLPTFSIDDDARIAGLIFDLLKLPDMR